VSKWYGPVIGVNDVTLELRPGIMGLVGANGAGKTTLMRLATGQLRPDLGTVRVRGRRASAAPAKRDVGWCPDADAFYEEMSGEQFVRVMARLCGYPRAEACRRADEALELVGMSGVNNGVEKPLRGYSKGMRQRIKLAQALVHDPELLVLDEPLSGIDPVGRQEFIALFHKLAERGKCLLVSSHELEALEKLTEQVIVMARGRIAAVGTLSRIREMFDDVPLAIRIDCTEKRRLSAALLELDDVSAVELGEESALTVRAANPKRFFRLFGGLVLEEGFEIEHLEILDDSATAILGYLLTGRSN
jgi:ABC-2 type transport system ATP-binding protein